LGRRDTSREFNRGKGGGGAKRQKKKKKEKKTRRGKSGGGKKNAGYNTKPNCREVLRGGIMGHSLV